jgi:cobalt-zinc-cadmium efflux system protein
MMPQHHNHHHRHHQADNYNRAFALAVGLNIIFVILEASYGLWANSLALIADAGHNLGDVLGLLLAWGASLLAKRKPSPRRTYGLRRVTILASLLSALLLLTALGAMAWEAINRLQIATPVPGLTLIVVAGMGVVINTLSALLFVADHQHDLNIKGAFLHMAADAAVSLGVVLAGVAILMTGWAWLDPVISLVISVMIFAGTWGLLRDSVNLAVDAVPRGIVPEDVETYLLSLPGVTTCHDLHIWGMSTTEAALTAHLMMPEGAGNDAFLHQTAYDLHERFGIAHTTIQIERGDAEQFCNLAPQKPV